MVTLKDIIQGHSDFFKFLQGEEQISIRAILPPDHATKNDLCFISNKKQWDLAINSSCINWIVLEKFIQTVAAENWPKDINLLSCKNIQVGMAIGLTHFDDKKKCLPFTAGISPFASVHPSAELGKNVTIAPYSLIGPLVKIGANTIIGPHCTIEGQSEIGENSWLESHIFVGSHSQIGSFCRLKPFASIASDGYGFAPIKDDILKIPQIGRVVIEDHVQIGSNTCIDKATLTETRIGKGTKIDNLVHIAHNCKIGNYCMITAGFATAGSTVIDDNFVCGGRVAIADHVHITRNVTLAGASIVTGNIEEPGAYGGSPIQTMQEYLKSKASLVHLPKLRKQMSRVLKHLGLPQD
jgi:UDP-3-O-[3-hydroxymyristoyl] glucosamine N-acyltransferase